MSEASSPGVLRSVAAGVVHVAELSISTQPTLHSLIWKACMDAKCRWGILDKAKFSIHLDMISELAPTLSSGLVAVGRHCELRLSKWKPT